MNTTAKKMGGLAAGVLLSAGLLCGSIVQSAQAHGAAHGTAQNVTVTITDNGYSPSSINVKGGHKVHMTFLSKGDSCANGVSIPALKKSFALKKGQKREIVFTPKKGQTINFACSMKMFKGKIVAK